MGNVKKTVGISLVVMVLVVLLWELAVVMSVHLDVRMAEDGAGRGEPGFEVSLYGAASRLYLTGIRFVDEDDYWEDYWTIERGDSYYSSRVTFEYGVEPIGFCEGMAAKEMEGQRMTVVVDYVGGTLIPWKHCERFSFFRDEEGKIILLRSVVVGCL